MFLSNNDKLRHRILKMLSAKAEQFAAKNQAATDEELFIPVTNILKELKISEEKFLDVVAPMIAEKEIAIRMNAEQKRLARKNDNTLNAYYSRKYINQGKEKFRKNVLFYVSLGTIVSLGLSICNTIISHNGTKNENTEIKQLQKRLDTLEGRKNTIVRP